MSTRSWLAALSLASLLVGCAPTYGPVTDSSGARFVWECGDAGCRLVADEDAPVLRPCVPPLEEGWNFYFNRFVDICSGCSSESLWVTQDAACRLSACETDAECPVIDSADPALVYLCQNGLCQREADVAREELTRHEVVRLCFADEPRSDTGTPDEARFEEIRSLVAAGCPGDDPNDLCPLPAECWAP